MNRWAVGILIKDRWDLTYNTLMSLYYADQPRSYDIFLFDNASTKKNASKLKDFVNMSLIPIKNAYCFSNEVSISEAWNLFLALTSDYDYRVKLDNDLILLRTMVPSAPKKPDNFATPADADPLFGAPRSGTIIGGTSSPSSSLRSASAGVRSKSQQLTHKSSKYLDYLEDFSRQYKVDISSLAPIPPDISFPSYIQSLASKKINGRNYLIGGCVQISRQAFEKLGFFDERLTRCVDIEYSQRAIRNGLNIGYHPSYWTIHMGSNNHTDQLNRDQKYSESMQILQTNPIDSCPDSVWDSVLKSIKKASKKHQIVNIE